MDTDVVHLVGQLTLGLEQVNSALLELLLDVLNGVDVVNFTLADLLPEELRVTQEEYHVRLFEAD